MQPMTDYEAYKMYMALKAHFQTEKYDAIAMKGKIRVSQKSYLGSGKSFSFQRLVKQYKDDEICDFMVANFVAGNRWGGVFDVDAGREYQAWKRKVESLRYNFKLELEALCNAERDAGKDMLDITEGQHPLLLKEHYGGRLSIETLVILNRILDFVPELDEKLSDTLMWADTSRLIRKYRPFLRIDLTPYQKIYGEIINKD